MKSNEPSCTPVNCLDLFSSPATVRFAVPNVISYPINRCAMWLLAHISKKVLKLKPAFANAYSLSAIKMKCVTAWVSAAINDGTPGIVGIGVRASRSMTMFCGSSCSRIPNKTPARFRIPTVKALSKRLNNRSAVAPALPDGFPIFTGSQIANNREPTELLSNYVFPHALIIKESFQ